jgi:hypothetical protein
MKVVAGFRTALVLFLSVLTLSSCTNETSWNQRLTLVIETPEGEVRGSAVTRVTKTETSGSLVLMEARGVRSEVEGEAVAVEVAPGKFLFALLSGSGEEKRDATQWVRSAYQLSEADSHGGEMMKLLTQPHDTPVPLPPEAWPLLVTFDDITKPETVRKVDPEDLAAVFGEGVRLKAVTLEITEEAVTEGRVERVLGWLCGHMNPHRRLSGKSGAIADNELSNRLGPGSFSIGGCK